MKGLFFFLAAALFLISGCTAILAARAASSASAGTSLYVNGEMLTDYYAPIDKVWKACEKTASDMHASDVIVDHEFRDGAIDATINGNKVRFSVTYKQKGITSVGIRVGVLGDETSSQFLHDRVDENIRGAIKEPS